jgi:uncharacterized membrane protein YozB (DUF420 family)
MSILISPQANLGLQVLTLVILLVGFMLKQRRKYFLHGVLMLVAVIMNALSFFLIMGPSLFSMREFVADYTLDRLSIVTVVHVAFGATAEILAAAIVVLWHLQKSTQACVRRKRLMKVTLILWVLALLLGILFYALAYVSA